jgi:hypothetical protein
MALFSGARGMPKRGNLGKCFVINAFGDLWAGEGFYGIPNRVCAGAAVEGELLKYFNNAAFGR